MESNGFHGWILFVFNPAPAAKLGYFLRHFEHGIMSNRTGPAYIDHWDEETYIAYWVQGRRHRIHGPVTIRLGSDHGYPYTKEYWIEGEYVNYE